MYFCFSISEIVYLTKLSYEKSIGYILWGGFNVLNVAYAEAKNNLKATSVDKEGICQIASKPA